jgi:hypothetical protein
MLAKKKKNVANPYDRHKGWPHLNPQSREAEIVIHHNVNIMETFKSIVHIMIQQDAFLLHQEVKFLVHLQLWRVG